MNWICGRIDESWTTLVSDRVRLAEQDKTRRVMLMNDSLEALIALSKSGTMAATATRLRITASAVSKRIAHLEEQTGYAVIEKDGRLVRLTPAGIKLVERIEPLLSELREALTDGTEFGIGELTIGVSESILASWGAKLLTTVERQVPGLKLKLSSHRSPVVIQRVLSGEYALGICAGSASKYPDLIVEKLCDEELVIVPSGLKKFSLGGTEKGPIDVLTIEQHSSTWESLKSQVRKLATDHSHDLSIELRVKNTLQSFTSVVQLAKEGYAHGLVPEGIALAMGVPKKKLVYFPNSGLVRPVSLVGRPSTLSRSLVRSFCAGVRIHFQQNE